MSRLRWSDDNGSDGYSDSYTSRHGRYGSSRSSDSRYRYNGYQENSFQANSGKTHPHLSDLVISCVNQVHQTVGGQCLMRVPDTNTVKPEPDHGRTSLQDRNTTPVAPVDINMGTFDTLHIFYVLLMFSSLFQLLPAPAERLHQCETQIKFWLLRS